MLERVLGLKDMGAKALCTSWLENVELAPTSEPMKESLIDIYSVKDIDPDALR